MTLTVFLDAVRFFACAAFNRDIGLNTLEIAWMSIVGHHSGFLDLLFVSGLVQTANTGTIWPTDLTLIEAVAVEFQTANF